MVLFAIFGANAKCKTRIWFFANLLIIHIYLYDDNIKMFSLVTSIYFLAVRTFLQITRIKARREWRHHPSKYSIVMLLSLPAIPRRSLSQIRSKLVIASMSIWLSKYHRVSARRRKQQELSSIRESLQQRCEHHLASLSTTLNCTTINRYAMPTHCVFHRVYSCN